MDHTSDPHAARYEIDPERLDLALEFRRKPSGPYGPELSRLVHRMRWGAFPGRYLLLTLEPGKRWALAQMPNERGEKVRVFHDVQFDSLDDAEWHVFQLRWKAITGRDLQLPADA
jgi:hypothetical protein